MPHYRNYGKIETPLTDQDFKRYMESGRFVQRNHRGYVVLLYYIGCRKTEGLNVRKQDIRISDEFLFVDIFKRLKGSKKTPILPLPLNSLYINDILESFDNAFDRLWPYSEKTGYNIVNRVLPYPHLLRLSRITRFFLDGYTIPEVQSWTGLSLRALNYYIGVVSIAKMGESMKVSIDPSIAESLV